jgi:hypothetical protein
MGNTVWVHFGVETKAIRVSKSTFDRGPSLIGSLAEYFEQEVEGWKGLFVYSSDEIKFFHRSDDLIGNTFEPDKNKQTIPAIFCPAILKLEIDKDGPTMTRLPILDNPRRSIKVLVVYGKSPETWPNELIEKGNTEHRAHLAQPETLESRGWPLLTGWNWGVWGLKEGKWKWSFLGLVQWACRAGTRDFCSAPGPIQNIFFFTAHYFKFLWPHAQQAGQTAVLGHLFPPSYSHQISSEALYMIVGPWRPII